MISRVPDQNGVCQAWYIVEIHHSGWKPSIYSFCVINVFLSATVLFISVAVIHSFSPLCAIWHMRVVRRPPSDSVYCCFGCCFDGLFRFLLTVHRHVFFSHPLFLFPWDVHCSVLLRRELSGIWHTLSSHHQRQLSLHHCPVLQVFTEDCVWPKDFESVPQALVLEDFQLLLMVMVVFQYSDPYKRMLMTFFSKTHVLVWRLCWWGATVCCVASFCCLIGLLPLNQQHLGPFFSLCVSNVLVQ